MKAMVFREYGSPAEVLHLEDVERPAVKSNAVLVRVHAAAVNWADWSLVQGKPYVMRAMYGPRRPRKGLVGTDVAGTVEEVGEKVTGLRPGDEVFGWANGAFAEYVSAKADHFVPKPTSSTFEEAAGIAMAGCVALQALRDVAKIEAGQTVLVNGASGGIGSYMVQIAKTLGAKVTGVSSTENVDLVRSLGADHVIDYTTDDFTRGDERYDLIFDIADNKTIGERRRVLTPKGTLIPNSGIGGAWFGSLGRIMRARLMSPFVAQKLAPFLSVTKQHDMLALKEMVESGNVTPVVDSVRPLSEAGEAIEYVGAGHVRGKVIITV